MYQRTTSTSCMLSGLPRRAGCTTHTSRDPSPLALARDPCKRHFTAVSPPNEQEQAPIARQSPPPQVIHQSPRQPSFRRSVPPGSAAPRWSSGMLQGHLFALLCDFCTFSAEISYNGGSPPRQGPAVPAIPAVLHTAIQQIDRQIPDCCGWLQHRVVPSNPEHHARSP